MKHWPGKNPPPQWSVQDAKARFSELLDATVKDGPQVITKRGVETAVLVPLEEWKRLAAGGRRTLKELLLADEPRFDFDLPRIPYKQRPPFDLED